MLKSRSQRVFNPRRHVGKFNAKLERKVTCGKLLESEPVSSFGSIDIPTDRRLLDYNAYLRTPYWRRLREEIIAHSSACKHCGSRHQLQVHHRYYYTKHHTTVLYHERRYPDVLVVLCGSCHKKQHQK